MQLNFGPLGGGRGKVGGGLYCFNIRSKVESID